MKSLLRFFNRPIIAYILVIILYIFVQFSAFSQTTVVSYDFNNTAHNWTSPTGGWGWGNGLFTGSNGSYLLVTPSNPYSNNLNILAVSPILNLSGYVSLTLSIRVRYDTEAAWDGAEIEYSTDGGSSWSNLGSVGSGTNWYNDTDVDAIANGADGWSGDNGGWQTATITLPAGMENNNLGRIRIRFASDDQVDGVGVGFDDIVITGTSVAGSGPGGVASSQALWLKADEGITGTSTVSAWTDQSTSLNNAAQATSSRQPQFIDDAINFNPILKFDGTDDFLDVPFSNELNGNEMTVFSVHRVETDNNSWRSPFTSRGNGPERGYLVYVRSDNDNYDLWTGVGDSGIGTWDGFQQALQPGADTQLLGVTFTASSTGNGDKSFFMDGFLLASTTNTEYYSPNIDRPYRVGAGATESTSGAFFWYGDIAEQIVFNKVLSTVEREKVESYLAIKYGLTLTHDYYNTSYDGTNAATTTIYDIDNGYGNDVAGIGQENVQGLYQPKSKSENDDAILTVGSPSNLNDNEYLVWGNNGLDGSTTSGVPVGYSERLNRVWYFSETGDVGSVSVKFDLDKIGGRSENPNDYAVLINNGSATFAGSTPITTGINITNGVLTITNVPIADGDYLTLALPGAGAPGGVSTNLNVWLKAGAVGTEVDGVTLDFWPDQSGQSNHAEPAPFNRPLLEAGLLNNNDYLSFTSDNAGTVTLPATGNAATVFAVVNTSTSGGDIFEQDNDTNPRLEVEGSTYRLDGDGSIVSSISIGNWNIVGTMYGGAVARQLFVDGILEDTNGSGIAIPASADYNLFTDYTGSAAELIYYSSDLNDVDRRKVESYLAVKYGITLDITSQNYLDGAGNTILDRTSFTSYSFNIAGIGRANADNGVNAQKMNQTESSSVNASAFLTIGDPSDMTDGEYLLWGANNETALASIGESIPAPAITGVTQVLDRKWKITETGEVGSVKVAFDVSSVNVVADRELAHFTLVIDDTENMSSPKSILRPASYSNGVVTFEGVNFDEGDYMVLGTDVSAAPAAVAGDLVLWLKAGLDVTGTSVSTWEDQSTSGFSATQGTAANQPAYNASAVNFNPSLTFDGDDYMSLGNVMDYRSGADEWSFFCVFNPVNTGTLLSRASSGTSTDRQYQYYVSGGVAGNIIGGTANTGAATVTGSWNIMESQVSTTAVNTWINGLADITNGGIGSSFETTNVLLGARSGGAGFVYTGDIAEVIMYNKAMSAFEKDVIETYLGVKYGITLSHDYYSSAYDGSNAASTTLYDVSNGYGNDIAGIGRDDSGFLYQPKSISSNTDAILTVSNPQGLDDGEYLMWGNNDAALTETSTGTPASVNDMLQRKWYISETGEVQATDLTFDVSGIAGVGGAVTDFALIVDTDADFSSGARIYKATGFAANVVSFDGVDLNDGDIVGLATGVASTVNEIANTVGDYSVTSGCPVISGHGYIDVRDASNKLVFSINPNGNDLGETCWGVRIRTSGSSSDDLTNGNDYYLDRNFFITPTNQPVSDVDIKFYILTSEVNDIRSKLAADGHPNGSDEEEYLQDFIKITKQRGSDLNPLTNDGGKSAIDPDISTFYSDYSLDIAVSSFSEFAPGNDSDDPNRALPVEMLYFEGRITDNNDVQLNWATATEINNDYFEVQRSDDGVNFVEIAKIQGNGTINQKVEYSYLDKKSSLKASFYRLRQVDYDGTYAYSQIVRVDKIENQITSGQPYPNPTTGKVTFRTGERQEGDLLTVNVFDLSGHRINARVISDLQKIEVDLSGFERGIYLISISDTFTSSTYRIVKE